jgi:sugar/nucleoside kinase (ribokinase family)
VTSRLIQLSGVCADLVYRVEAVPAPGEDAIVRGGAAVTAGGGFNAMVAARRAGLTVAFAGTLGTGPLADICAAGLVSEGIECLRPRVSGMDQGCCTVLVDDTGERTFIASEGAEGQVTDADMARLPPHDDDWWLVSGYCLTYPGSRRALTSWMQANSRGLKLLFDPCPHVALIPADSLAAVMQASAWISANETEATFLTGNPDPAGAAEMLATGRAGAVVRSGAAGCHLAQAGRGVQYIPPHPVRAIDTNGAGDCHTGVFLALLAQDFEPRRAAFLANIAAALSTTREGPSTAPHLHDVLEAAGEASPAIRPD